MGKPDEKQCHYHKEFKCFGLVLSIMAVLLLVGMYCGLRFGTVTYSHGELMETLQNPLRSTPLQDIIVDIHMPRVLAAALVGAAMAISGAIMQGMTRNAIADPGLLGINAGAGFALILGYAFIPNIHYSLILLICFTGSLIAVFLVSVLSYQPGRGYSQLRLILAGSMVAAFFAAIGQAVTIYFQLSESVIGWQAGGLVGVNWKMLFFIAPFILSGLLFVQFLAHQLTILSLDETLAKSLGQKTLAVTLGLMGIVILMAAAAVALVGAIGFVGLIIPHFVRLFVHKDYRLILPLTGLAGAGLLVWVDLISRTINPPSEIPLGTIISFIGVPAFLWLIRKERHL